MSNPNNINSNPENSSPEAPNDFGELTKLPSFEDHLNEIPSNNTENPNNTSEISEPQDSPESSLRPADDKRNTFITEQIAPWEQAIANEKQRAIDAIQSGNAVYKTGIHPHTTIFKLKSGEYKLASQITEAERDDIIKLDERDDSNRRLWYSLTSEAERNIQEMREHEAYARDKAEQKYDRMELLIRYVQELKLNDEAINALVNSEKDRALEAIKNETVYKSSIRPENKIVKLSDGSFKFYDKITEKDTKHIEPLTEKDEWGNKLWYSSSSEAERNIDKLIARAHFTEQETTPATSVKEQRISQLENL